MAKKKKTTTKPNSKHRFQKTKSFFGSRQTQTIIGLFITLFAIFLFSSFLSYLFNWQQDQSQLSDFADKNITVKNLLGKIGASISHFFIFDGFGVISIYIPVLLFFSGLLIFLKGSLKRIRKSWGWGILGIIWFSIAFGFFAHKNALLAGVVGYELNSYLQQFLGKTGLFLVLLFFFFSYLVVRFKLTPELIRNSFSSKKSKDNLEEATKVSDTSSGGDTDLTEEKTKSAFDLPLDNPQATSKKYTGLSDVETKGDQELEIALINKDKTGGDVEIAVERIVEENHVVENLSDKLVKDLESLIQL